MYPLLLKAPVKDYLWGGTRLKTEYGFETEAEKAAEAWVLSCHRDGTCTVENGEYSGLPLTKVLEKVHPDDEFALKNEGEYGKTEMWYVVDCEEGASLIYGFNREVSKEEFERRIKDNTLDKVCNYVPVHKGDVFFIKSGTLHAIGAGILIAEVQQNSNTTYRVSDYGRLGADGKPRPLHIEKAVQVTNREKPTLPYGNVGEVETSGSVSRRHLAECRYFTSELMTLDGLTALRDNDSFVSAVVLSGNAKIVWADGAISAVKGNSVFIPAGTAVEISGKAEILLSYIGG